MNELSGVVNVTTITSQLLCPSNLAIVQRIFCIDSMKTLAVSHRSSKKHCTLLSLPSNPLLSQMHSKY